MTTTLVRGRDLDHSVWGRVDWTQSDARIAKRLGVTKNFVNSKRKDLGLPCATYEKRATREQFRRFLKGRPKQAKETNIDELIRLSKLDLTTSSAYRIARSLKFRGTRKNKSRYSDFWKQLNWHLPDSDLAEIWGVERGNIQSKRRSLGKDRPMWSRAEWSTSSVYQQTKGQEEARAAEYTGRKPV